MCCDNGYQSVESQYKKLVETFEMSSFRQGVMLVGHPYTGKSFVLKTLIDAIKTKNQLKPNDLDVGKFIKKYPIMSRSSSIY